MRLKSYFASSVEAAISQARQELGEDALLVQSRRSMPEARHLGEYEVVFADLPPSGTVLADARPGKAAETEASSGPGPLDRLGQEVADLRRQMERMAWAFEQAQSAGSGLCTASPELAAIHSELVAAGLAPGLAREILVQVPAGGEAGSRRSAAREAIARRWRVDSRLGRPGSKRRVVVLVGPPGHGKTTTLVKLAMTHGLTARRPAQLISVDMRRVGGAEQLRSYAAILGIGFQAAETLGVLVQMLEENRHKELILIDTPGIASREMEDYQHYAQFFSTHPEMDVHLVLSAAMKSADLTRAVDRFEAYRPGKLLFTRLDETSTWGTLVSEAIRTGKPVSFVADGQQIPEDLHEAEKEKILDLLLEEKAASALAA